jgi:hypothetical protein
MATMSFDSFIKKAGGTKDQVQVVGNENSNEYKKSALGFESTPEPSFMEKAGQFSTGIAKDLLSNTIGTAQTLQNVGQRSLAAIDPTQSFEDVRNTTGFKSLQGPQAEEINKSLESETPYETAGKVTSFLGQLLYPVGKAEEVAGLAQKGKQAVGASVDSAADLLGEIPENITEGGKNVRNVVSQVLGTLDDATKTALKRTPKDVFESFVEKGKAALADDRNQTPLEFVGESVADGLQHAKEVLSSIGQRKTEAVTKLPEAFEGSGVKQFGDKLQSFMNSRDLIDNDKGAVGQIVGAFKKLGSTPTKGQVDRFVDFAQDILYSGEKNLSVPMTDKTTGALRNLVNGLNDSLKGQLPEEYRKMNEEYSDLVKFVGELNKKLGVEGGNAGALVKRLFSPSDARTKELFTKLGEITGDDYFRDARLAKFVMDSMGDTRAASLLKGVADIPTSAKGVLEKAVNYGLKKISEPIDAARGFIEKGPINMNEGKIKIPQLGSDVRKIFKQQPDYGDLNAFKEYVDAFDNGFKDLPEGFQDKNELIGTIRGILDRYGIDHSKMNSANLANLAEAIGEKSDEVPASTFTKSKNGQFTGSLKK